MPGDDLQIRPLSPGMLPAWLQCFDHEAFVDHPRWASGCCQHMLVDPAVVCWPECRAQQNRDRACDRVACGRMPGLIAWRGGRVVGWCHAARRPLMDALKGAAAAPAPAAGASR